MNNMSDHRKRDSAQTRAKKQAAAKKGKRTGGMKAREQWRRIHVNIEAVVRSAKKNNSGSGTVPTRDVVFYLGRLETSHALGCMRLG